MPPGSPTACSPETAASSPAPWAALNVGATVGDDPLNVQENRRLAFAHLVCTWTRSSTSGRCTAQRSSAPKSRRPLEEKHIKADAILTDRPGVTLFMRFADCTPILLFDPPEEGGRIGACRLARHRAQDRPGGG